MPNTNPYPNLSLILTLKLSLNLPTGLGSCGDWPKRAHFPLSPLCSKYKNTQTHTVVLPSRSRGFVLGRSQNGFNNVLLKNKEYTQMQLIQTTCCVLWYWLCKLSFRSQIQKLLHQLSIIKRPSECFNTSDIEKTDSKNYEVLIHTMLYT